MVDQMSSREFDYDVAIIGGGSGGYAAARTAAGAGQRTVVVEGGREVGGLCILRGCMPTKALLYAAEVMHLVRHPSTWGVLNDNAGFDFAQVMARKDRLIKEFADYRHGQLKSGVFAFIRASARFTDNHSLVLDNGQTLTAKNFVISSGSSTAPSPLPALDEAGYLTSDTALSLTSLPRSIIVMGGGSVAVEFAQFFARFGVKVSVVQRGEHLLREFDTDAAAELARAFRREGIELYTGTRLLTARRDGATKSVSFLQGDRTVHVSVEEIFLALGRVPNTARLGLEAAGVSTERGRIVTDHEMRTSAANIFAAGDCTSPYEIVHVAIQQGEIAGHNVAYPDSPRQIDYRLITSVVFTEPQVATVGLTEKAARARGVPFLAASYPFSEHGKALIMEAKDGFVKLLAHPENGEILGGSCVGPMGGELIHEIIAAMYKRMTVAELAAMPHYHPTLAEIWTYPAEELAEQIAGGPPR